MASLAYAIEVWLRYSKKHVLITERPIDLKLGAV